jgi:CoA:oxalate CoA-transferase
MLDCQVAILENALARYFVTGESPKPEGNRHASIVPFEPFDTSDGKIMIAAGNDNLWRKLCKALEIVDMASDERFMTNPLRNKNYDSLRPLLAVEIKKKTTEEWQRIFIESGVPSGPINNVEMVVKDEQVLARNMIQEVLHPVAGLMHLPGIPIKISDCDDNIRFSAPTLGQHTEDILHRYLDYSVDQIKALRDENVI